MPENAESDAEAQARTVQKRLDKLALRYGEDLVKESCRRYAEVQPNSIALKRVLLIALHQLDVLSRHQEQALRESAVRRGLPVPPTSEQLQGFLDRAWGRSEPGGN